MIHKTKQVRRNYKIIALVLILLAIAIGIIGVVTIRAETAPTDYQIHLEWGDTLHILCSEDAFNSHPNGIVNLDITGSDVMTMTCRPPGTDKVE